jgi:hypothetical protein
MIDCFLIASCKTTIALVSWQRRRARGPRAPARPPPPPEVGAVRGPRGGRADPSRRGPARRQCRLSAADNGMKNSNLGLSRPRRPSPRRAMGGWWRQLPERAPTHLESGRRVAPPPSVIKLIASASRRLDGATTRRLDDNNNNNLSTMPNLISACDSISRQPCEFLRRHLARRRLEPPIRRKWQICRPSRRPNLHAPPGRLGIAIVYLSRDEFRRRPRPPERPVVAKVCRQVRPIKSTRPTRNADGPSPVMSAAGGGALGNQRPGKKSSPARPRSKLCATSGGGGVIMWRAGRFGCQRRRAPPNARKHSCWQESNRSRWRRQRPDIISAAAAG